MGSIKDRNDMDQTEAEEIKKYTLQVYIHLIRTDSYVLLFMAE